MPANQILDKNYRKSVISEIESDENVRRKQESLKRFEIYNDRLEEYVYDILQNDLSQETLSNMRVISSINLCRRIIDEQSSIYTKRPDRMINNSDEKTDELIDNIYSLGRFNTALKKANVAFNLQDQCALQVIPKGGKFKLKVLQPHHYDVVPNVVDPERPDIYILSQYDKNRLFDRVDNSNNNTPQTSAVEYRTRDRQNQSIGDEADWQSKRGIYVWWSDFFHFITDDNGDILDPVTMLAISGEIELEDLANPLGKMPFVDIKEESDGEYWQRFGNATVDFTLDMAIVLSDVAEVNRLQGFAQAVISATEPPVNMKVGANTLMFLKKSKNAEASAQPTFEFVSPNPDLSGSIEVIKTFLSLFLTSKGLDPAVVTADGTGGRFASGVDRLLSNIEKFEASADDFALFKWVEKEIFSIIRSWLDVFSGVSEGGLDPELSGIIPEDVSFDVQFDRPSSEISGKDKYDLLIQKVDDGAMSMVELVMADREVDETKARDILEDIESEKPDLKLQSLGVLSGDREQEA